jgi:hypothetical protein
MKVAHLHRAGFWGACNPRAALRLPWAVECRAFSPGVGKAESRFDSLSTEAGLWSVSCPLIHEALKLRLHTKSRSAEKRSLGMLQGNCAVRKCMRGRMLQKTKMRVYPARNGVEERWSDGMGSLLRKLHPSNTP